MINLNILLIFIVSHSTVGIQYKKSDVTSVPYLGIYSCSNFGTSSQLCYLNVSPRISYYSRLEETLWQPKFLGPILWYITERSGGPILYPGWKLANFVTTPSLLSSTSGELTTW